MTFLLIVAVLVLLVILAKVDDAKKGGAKVDCSRWVCPHCDGIIQRDPVQTEMARRRYQTNEPIVIAAASRHPTCPKCTKPVDGQKLLSGGYDLPMERYKQLRKQGVLE